MRVDIWTDIVCPWCYIGQARFDAALAGFEHRDQVEVVQHSYELAPDLAPADAGRVLEMLMDKYGMSREQAEQAEARVAGLAAGEGLPYTSDRPNGNTFDAHRLLHLAAERGLGDELRRALYRANFGGEGSVFDADSLTAIATGTGLDEAEVRSVLAADAYGDAVREDERTAREIGVQGVPFFVLDGKYGVSGAQETATFAEALTQVWQEAHAQEAQAQDARA
ncbi:DsbA family oxidoreductase [Actinomadura rupiterrae]|uniref:DsbA family oxidoreductase n=1 Tax=Actinomadura rupiterrae TaxID=559627 RepID=UPI0020A49953|nr:DsbA family oxidoreductase [Actinomadura rupiterrae]MCP2342850.1 putative DsbA family dithiol-disulfide isomerase [Actinomadura rupiterrae]